MNSKATLTAVLAVGILHLPVAYSHARLGETLEDCGKRYGNPVAERVAKEDMLLFRDYTNASFSVTIAFIRKDVQPFRAGAVAYTQRVVMGTPISDAAAQALMATVPGEWAPYQTAPKLGQAKKIKTTSVKPNQVALDRRKRAAEVITQLIPKMPAVAKWRGDRLDDLGHLNSQVFAFRHYPYTVILISQEGTEVTESYLRQVKSEEAFKPALPAKPAPPPGL